MKRIIQIVTASVLVLVLALFLAWQGLINPVASGVTACFQVHNDHMDGIYEQAVAMADRAARVQLICTADIESTSSLRGCLREVKSQNLLGDVLINDIPNLGWNTRKRINFAVREHNEQCPGMPIAEERV